MSLWQISLNVMPDVYGQYSLYLSIVGFASMLFIGWPNAAILRYGREEWNQRQSLGEILATRFLLYFAGVIVALLLAASLNSLTARLMNTAGSQFFLIAFGIILIPLSEIGIYANQATGRSLPWGLSPFISQMIFLTGIFFISLMSVNAGVKYLASWFLAGSVMSAAAVFVMLPKTAWSYFRPSMTAMRNILHYSWALPFGAIASYTVNWVDAWVIRAYMDTYNVGIYTWAYQITAIGGLAFAPLSAILTPSMIDARLSGNTKLLSRHGHVSLSITVLTGIAGLLLLVMVYPVLSIAAGSQYMKAYMVILILLSSIPFHLLGYLVTPILCAYEFLIPKTVFVSIGIAIANIIGDLLLVPLIGINGAALATWTVFFISGILQVYLIIRFVPNLKFPTLLRFSIGSLIMSCGVLSLWLAGPLVGAVLCIAVSILSVVAARRMGLVSSSDVRWLESQPGMGIIKRPIVVLAKWLTSNRGSF